MVKVRVLGCSGAIAEGCITTSFLIDADILVDAGTGVGDLTLREMRSIDHVLAAPFDCIAKGKSYPIYITHTQPAEAEQIMSEIQRFDQTLPLGPHVTHGIRWLRAGPEFDL